MDMDNHPIPQDVTHFQFKLIGEMTLKQFGYVAAGSVLAYIFLSLPINLFVRIPFAALYAGTGAILAFIPIEGRPADTMIKQFIKALFSSTQYLYHKESADPTLSALLEGTINSQTLAASPVKQIPTAPAQSVRQASQTTTLQTQPVFIKNTSVQQGQITQPSARPAQTKPGLPDNPQTIKPMTLDEPKEREMVNFQAPSGTIQTTNPKKQKTLVTPAPQVVLPEKQEESEEKSRDAAMNGTIPENTKLDEEEKELKQEADKLASALEQAKAAEQQQQGTPGFEQAHQKALELEEQLQRASEQKQRLEQELVQLRQQLASQPQQVYSPTTAAAPQQQTTHVRRIPKEMLASVGLPGLPDTPNLITGIIKDSRGNVLPGILIEIKDTEGNPVRAFKTNQLGQFASATPLLNGTYTITFEDPADKHRFDAVEITAEGDILLPIEIISIDQREELRKELFG